MSFGVEIHFLDGSKDWIDPVDVEPQEILEELVVANRAHEYSYALNTIKKWVKYDLCEECLCDLRSSHRKNCSKGEK